jgi:hypothetical protein
VFRIIFPVVDYALNYNYIVEELCENKDVVGSNCNGKCHLSKEIKKQVDTTNNEQKIILIDFLKIPHTIVNNYNLICVQIPNAERFKFFNIEELIHKKKPQIPPPKFI